MSSKNSIKSTLIVAFCLCVVCSIIVSGTAVVLKPRQDANRILDRNKNILAAAGLYDSAVNSDGDVDSLFAQFTTRVVDINSGELLSEAELENLGLDAGSYDQRLIMYEPEL